MGESFMRELKKYLKKKKYLLLFVGILFSIGLIVGLILSITHINWIQNDILYFANHLESQTYEYTLFHFFLLVVSLFFSFFGIGIPILCTILFYEGMSLGFLIGSFTLCFQLKGLLFSILFYLITKGAYLLILIFFFFKCIEIARKMIGKYIYKTNPSMYIVKMLKGTLILIFFVFLIDSFLYFFATPLITIFRFLLVS